MNFYQPAVRITDKDLERIAMLIENQNSHNFAGLSEELNRADVVPQNQIQKNVVTMNSRVRFLDLKTQQEFEATLVYPQSADAAENKISILAPVGSALLGLRTGQKIVWPLPDGKVRHLQVISVLYQPEASGDWAL